MELKEYSKHKIDYKQFTKHNDITLAHPHFERLFLENDNFYILLCILLIINLFIVVYRIDINMISKIVYTLPMLGVLIISFKKRLSIFINSLE